MKESTTPSFLACSFTRMSYGHINSIRPQMNLSLPTVLFLPPHFCPDGQYHRLPRYPIEEDGSYVRPLLLLQQPPKSLGSLSSICHLNCLLCFPTTFIKVPMSLLVYGNSVLSNFPVSKRLTTLDLHNWSVFLTTSPFCVANLIVFLQLMAP